MKKVRTMPPLATVLVVVACQEDGGPTAVDTRARVRFFNATTGKTGSGGFATNGQFATSGALASGLSTRKYSRVDAGPTSSGFDTANMGGTGLSRDALATLNDRSITDGGSFTVAATGPAESPALLLLDHDFSGSVGTNEAAVRFVNLGPGTGTTLRVAKVFQDATGRHLPYPSAHVVR